MIGVTLRAFAVWLLLVVVASANGALREALLVPRLGHEPAHRLSTLLLCAMIALVAWWTVRWVGPGSRAVALAVGGLWLALLLAFEFLVGHHLAGRTWADLLGEYDVRQGRLWVLVPVLTFFAPLWAARARGLVAP
ncbi:MAG: hypothetical protein KIT58_02595 [Planctomycetota bacterium]|nr:hypothetical protein [Planctomycetota bacterium]